jgi:hypothetical protein
MLFTGRLGNSLVSDEFNQMCTDARVEARIQAFPNPGDPLKALRLITFKNYNLTLATVIQQSGKAHQIPAAIKGIDGRLSVGELQLMIKPDEELPKVKKD